MGVDKLTAFKVSEIRVLVVSLAALQPGLPLPRKVESNVSAYLVAFCGGCFPHPLLRNCCDSVYRGHGVLRRFRTPWR